MPGIKKDDGKRENAGARMRLRGGRHNERLNGVM